MIRMMYLYQIDLTAIHTVPSLTTRVLAQTIQQKNNNGDMGLRWSRDPQASSSFLDIWGIFAPHW